jgi:hypothetical protein
MTDIIIDKITKFRVINQNDILSVQKKEELTELVDFINEKKTSLELQNFAYYNDTGFNNDGNNREISYYESVLRLINTEITRRENRDVQVLSNAVNELVIVTVPPEPATQSFLDSTVRSLLVENGMLIRFWDSLTTTRQRARDELRLLQELLDTLPMDVREKILRNLNSQPRRNLRVFRLNRGRKTFKKNKKTKKKKIK